MSDMDLLLTSEELEVVEQKEKILINRILQLGSLLVAYSGGVDSSLVAFYAKKLLRNRARVVIGVSSSLAQESLLAARAQAELFNWKLDEIETDEINIAQYKDNDGMRCFFCKATLFSILSEQAGNWGIHHIASGANVNDQSELRPGSMAADQFKVESPLVDAGLTKKEIRFLARRASLPSWDRPQDACLASRIPINTTVSVDKLTRVERAEEYVRSLGFSQVRVRHFEERASVEVGADEVYAFKVKPHLVLRIEDELKKLGFSEVEIDPLGYRTGSVSGESEAPAFVKYGAALSTARPGPGF